MTNKAIIGAHVSAGGGLFKAFENAEKIGAEAVQIFGASPQQWTASLPKEADLKKFFAARHSSKINKVYLHAGYLVNLASPKKDGWEKSVKNLSTHLKIAEALEAEGLIFHLGSFGEGIAEQGIKKLVKGIRETFKAVPGKSRLLMENSAGGGNKLGKNLKELTDIFLGSDSSRLKICLDTAHAFEAGMIGYSSKNEVREFFNEWNKNIGAEQIEVIHANDSKTAFSSNHDRHENIGEGLIGINGFRLLANEPFLNNKTWILEVPGKEDTGPDAENIVRLKNIFN